jgi:hypothetical protein
VADPCADVRSIVSVLAAAPDRDRLRAAAATIARVRAWCDAAEVSVARALGSVAAVPEFELAAAMRTSVGVAGRAAARAAVVAELPLVEAALDDGRVHGAHVDEVTKVLRSLAPADHAALLERVDRLVDVAAVATPAEFGRRVRQEAARVRSDDGMSRLERQRGACRASSRVNTHTGMWELRAVFDPFTGACLSRKLEAATEALRHGDPIEHTPHDPFERAEFLRAHALTGFIDGTASGGSGSGRPEIVIVVNTSIDSDVTRALNDTTNRSAIDGVTADGVTIDGVTAGGGVIETAEADTAADVAEVGVVAVLARGSRTVGPASSSGRIPSERPDREARAGLPPVIERPTACTPAARDVAAGDDPPPRVRPPAIGDRSSGRAQPREPHPPPFSIDWGLPVEIPARVLTDLALDLTVNADVHVVVLRGGIILHAPGTLNLARSTRLANRAQRRALRARYPTCVRPGCEVPFHRCDLHHIVWWRHGGRTDLQNLAPLCARDHTLLHEQGWKLVRDHDGSVTITLSDGTVLATPEGT